MFVNQNYVVSAFARLMVCVLPLFCCFGGMALKFNPLLLAIVTCCLG